MCKKFILTLVMIVFSTAVAKAGGVTNIKEIVNNTSINLTVTKMEPTWNPYSGDYSDEIPPDGGVWTGDMWIPWADNRNDFTEKHMEVRIYRGTAFWIWQSGEFVLYNNRARFVSNARRVPGESRSGGERRLIISIDENGRPVFKFESL